MVARFLSFLGTNQYFLGFSSLCGAIGFVTSQYNKERISFQNTFEGHRKSIIVDGLQSKQLLTDILKNVEAYRAKFSEILSWREKIRLAMFIKQLKKEPNQADYNLICNYLASISGRLSKKGDMKNG